MAGKTDLPEGFDRETLRAAVRERYAAVAERPEGRYSFRVGREFAEALGYPSEIRAGYLARAASPADARRVRLELTDAGRELAGTVRRYQGVVFEQVTRGWSDRERQEFARLFIAFARAVAEHTAGVAAPDSSRGGAR